jgi:hypothetical protein
MKLTETEADLLDNYRCQYGHDAGTLALVLDRLTDALNLANRHTVYCRVEKGPRAGQPPTDLAELFSSLQTTKDLVQAILLRLRQSPDNPDR